MAQEITFTKQADGTWQGSFTSTGTRTIVQVEREENAPLYLNISADNGQHNVIYQPPKNYQDQILCIDIAEGALVTVVSHSAVTNAYYIASELDYYTKDEIDDKMEQIHQFEPVVASSLPTASADTMYKFYFIPKQSAGEQTNTKEEWMTVKEGSTYRWEKIGETDVDLSDYVTVDDLEEYVENSKSFKGWFDSSSALSEAYRSPKVGDYAYIKGATASDPAAIYECATAGTWSDSGRTVDSSSVQTFESGQEVNETYIDDTHLANPKSGALPVAENVMQIKAKLDGVSAYETKVEPILNTNVVTGKYISGETGLPVSPSSSASSYAYFTCDIPDNAKSIRFLAGTKPNNNYKLGYSVGYYDDEDNYVPARKFFFDTASPGVIEKTIELKDNENVFMTTCATVSSVSTLNLTNFYCYLKSGSSIQDIVNDINSRMAYSEAKTLTKTGIGYITSSGGTVIRGKSSSYTANKIYRQQISALGITVGNKVRITAGLYGARICFAKSGGTKANAAATSTSTIVLADGETSYRDLQAGDSLEVIIPTNTNYIFSDYMRYSSGVADYVDKTPTIELISSLSDVSEKVSDNEYLVKTMAKKAFFEDKGVVDETAQGYYTSDGILNQSETIVTCSINCEGYEYVRVFGSVYKNYSSQISHGGGFAFFKEVEDGDDILVGFYNLDYKSSGTVSKEYLIPVPYEATVLKAIYSTLDTDMSILRSTDFYCYLQTNTEQYKERLKDYLNARNLKFIGNSQLSDKDNNGAYVFAHITDCHGNVSATACKTYYDLLIDKIDVIKAISGKDNLPLIDDIVDTGDLLNYFSTSTEGNGMPMPWRNRSGNILTVIGNHDTKLETSESISGKWSYFAGTEKVYNKFIGGNVSNWNVEQPTDAEENHYCYYSKLYEGNSDTPSLLALFIDCMDWGKAANKFDTNYHQRVWMEEKLQEALQNEYHVIVFVHTIPISGQYNMEANERGKKNIRMLSCSWNPSSVDNFGDAGAGDYSMLEVVHDFQIEGGKFVGYVMGHNHRGYIGIVEGKDIIDGTTINYNEEYPQLVICGTMAMISGDYNSDVAHAAFVSSQYDTNNTCFRLIGIDTANEIVKVMQIGRTTTYDMREKQPIGISYKRFEHFNDASEVEPTSTSVGKRAIIEKDGYLWSIEEAVVDGLSENAIDWEKSTKRLRSRVISEDF